jgi:hypothetical protein
MIYFLRAGLDGHVKIGWTRDEGMLHSRIRSIQGAQPFLLVVLRPLDAPRWVETWLQGYFAGVRAAGEWFAYQPEVLTVEPPALETRLVGEGKVAMTRLTIDIPESLHTRIKMDCAAYQKKMSDAVRELLDGQWPAAKSAAA